MKIRFFRWYNAVLTALLAVLGYGCSKDEPMDMYGTPTARYHLSGTVADETGKRIDGILISIEKKNGNYWENLISKKSEYGGSYHVYFETWPGTWPESSSTKIIIQDIDGDANGGEFANDTIDINYQSAIVLVKGENFVDQGTYKIVQDIHLKKK